MAALRDARELIIGYLLIATDKNWRMRYADEFGKHRHHLKKLGARAPPSWPNPGTLRGNQPGQTHGPANISDELHAPMNTDSAQFRRQCDQG